MKLLQLEYFLKLAEKENLTQTAKELFISPPSLSATISKLESDIGYQLFNRVGKKIVLNDNGRIFLKYVKQIFHSIEGAKRELSEHSHPSVVGVSVALMSLPIWFSVFEYFTKKHPEIPIDYKIITLEQLESQELFNHFDFFLGTTRDIINQDFEYSEVFPSEAPVLLISQKHHFADRKSIVLSEAKDEIFISLGKENMSAHKFLIKICEVAGFKPKKIIECNYYFRVKLLEENAGIALTTTLGYDSSFFSNPNIVCVPISSPILTRTQAIVWSPNKYLSNSAIKFRECVLSYKK